MSLIEAIDGKIEIIFVQKTVRQQSCDRLKFVPFLALPTKSRNVSISAGKRQTGNRRYVAKATRMTACDKQHQIAC